MASTKIAMKTTGMLELELVGAKDTFPHCKQLSESTAAAFDGSVDDFMTKYADIGADVLRRQTKNKVKKCGSCGKPCAFTLSSCNGCGGDLTKTGISFSNNVFTGFIFGIAKGPFPFTVSMRHQSPDIMVFDDLLALTPCHVNCIPTNMYIPDVRYLFAHPEVGLKLIQKMFDSCWNVVSKQFLGDTAWLSKMVNMPEGAGPEDLKKHIAAGFNYPPSQYQLHLQFMLPIFTPYHHKFYNKGGHFTHERFLNFEFVESALQFLIATKTSLAFAHTMGIEEIFKYFEAKGVSYDKSWKACYDRYGASHRALATWSPADFNYATLNDGEKWFKMPEITPVTEGKPDYNQLKKDDKVTLQNYGRPYKAPKKPSGTFYKYAKTPPLKELNMRRESSK